MKHFKLLTLLVTLSTLAFAQTPYDMQYGSYTQNFDGLSNTGNTSAVFPTGWGLSEIGSNADTTYGISTGSSTAGDTYSFGATNSTDRALGGLLSGSLAPSYGFGFKNNTGYVLTSINVSATMEQWRASNSSGLDSCFFYYSTNASSLGDTGATWVALSALDMYSAVDPNSGSALDGNLVANQVALSGTITVSVAMGDTLFFKWIDLNISGSDDGLSVDDLTLTLSSASGPIPAGPPTLVSMSPMDNNTNVLPSTTALSFTFSDTITSLGTGNIYIKDLNNSANDVTVPASSLTQTGAVFTYSSLSLMPGTPYAVQIDPTTFFNGSIPFAGIGNNTDWNFATLSPPTAVTSLNETFTGCLDPDFGVFKAYSVTGSQDWRCTTFGHGDSNAVRMNGFSGGNKVNEDWLISPPLDFSGMTAPHLHFWSKLRFPANNVKEIMVSSDYTGLGDPTLANWSAQQVNNWTALDTNWKRFTNTDLTQFKSSNFFIAFKYNSDTTNADEWSVDDVLVTDGPLGLATFSNREFNVTVLGDVHATLNLQTQSSTSRKLDYSIVDLAGRKIVSGNLNIHEGYQMHRLATNYLMSGMYLLHLNNEEAHTTMKFIVK